MLLSHSLLFFALGISALAIPISPMTPGAAVSQRTSLSQKIKSKFYKVKAKLNQAFGKHTHAPAVNVPQAAVNVKESQMNGLWHAIVAPNLFTNPDSAEYNRAFYILIKDEDMVQVWPKEPGHDNLYSLITSATKQAWARVENPGKLRVGGLP